MYHAVIGWKMRSKKMKEIQISLKKLVKKCWHPPQCMVLYLSAKRWDKRMTSEAPAEKREKRTNRRWKVLRLRSNESPQWGVRANERFPKEMEGPRPDKLTVYSEKLEAIQVQNVRNASKKCLTKNHFCDKIIKSSAGRLRRTGPWKLNNIEKLVTEPIFVLEKHVKQFQTK